MAGDFLTVDDFEAVVDAPITDFAFQCHTASIKLVKSGFLGTPARVLRGTCEGVPGQHSWVALATKDDVYKGDIRVIDPTLWSYQKVEPYIWQGEARSRPHRPHGWGSIFQWGRPDYARTTPIVLPEPDGGWSGVADTFLRMLGPLDVKGWMVLFDAPMGDWPAGEILEQAVKVPKLAPLIPIDRLGMLTDLNPLGLYLPGDEKCAP